MNDWMYFSEPEAELGGRRIECARGKVVGGSSSINAMAHVRGHRGDYNRWASYGLPDWSYENVLPYFRRQETWEGGADAYRGGEGPLNVEKNRYPDPVCDAFTAAGVAAGYSVTPDYNGAQQEGFGAWQTTRRTGHRCSAADAYLRPALQRSNLSILVDTLVHNITFDQTHAAGVTFSKKGRTHSVRAEREVLLAAGAINTPQLLMLSGIGDPAHLGAHGIRVRVPLPNVGRNLQDHISSPVVYRRKEPGPLHRAMRVDRAVRMLADAYFRGEGLATALPAADMAFLRTKHATELPDVQILFVAAPMSAGPYLSPLHKPYADGFAARPAVLRPESQGSVELATANPSHLALIRQNFLSRDKDRRVLREGLRKY
jgi:choline dehydrogenase/4-pyridoxate dehydrogenase